MATTTDSSDLPTRLIYGGVTVALLVLGWRWLHPATSFAADGVDPRWDRAVEVSQATKQPGLVLVTADWCGGCQYMHSQVFSRSDVKMEIANHYTFFKVDMTGPSEASIALSRKLGVNVYPTLIRYDQNGKETDRRNGMTPEMTLEWLRAGE